MIKTVNIIDLEDNSKRVVHKSLPLIYLLKTVNQPFTVTELRLIDWYLSKIDINYSQNREITFNKRELANLFHLTKISNKSLEKSLFGLKQKTVINKKEILNPNLTLEELDKIYKNKELEYTCFSLFSNIQIDIDKTEIVLECNDKLVPYIFNVENLKYIKYKLKNIIKLRSKYSYNLFMYLELQSFNTKYWNKERKWIVDIEQFKKILGCEQLNYKSFADLNRNIIKPSLEDVNDNTDRHFIYKYIRTNKNVSHIEFTLDSINEKYIEAEIDDGENEKYEIEYLLYKERYSQEQLNKILEIVEEIPQNILLDCIPDKEREKSKTLPYKEYIELLKYFYVKKCYLKLLSQRDKRKIDNDFNYFLGILKREKEK